ncbi:calcineurin-like phosphoesterase family protein [Lichenihabitans sp. PAMC28606]|uniref:calcineurin-like phosphoesterase C-terminal domain-containing protein n=1 Tax=Lichenihabitans sp. PAMC28606 TaxID=2880932 RepID=UPI001D0A82B6|nr:calcineurin-like phosphoesterase family protein [Lichenihabitans sp. PAMC28606]UDL95912.1 calcineurin-like phosphoesterase family protein [Lichenihabitans sp. PAMC28606]
MDHDQESGLSRRDLLKSAALGGVGLALASGDARAAATAQADGSSATVRGIVFEDTGITGIRQADSRGVAGVLVSNGREVVKTDADGGYTLPLRDETIIFVIKPAGFTTPVEADTMLHRFYRINQPSGSPVALNLTFEGIEPTAPLPASLDFPLTRQDEPAQFEVVLFTDPQPQTPAEVDFIREDVVNALNGTPAKFGMTLGDMMFDDLSLYGRYNGIIATLGLPWYNIGGNHDLNFEAPNRHYSRETFKRTFGPPYYAFAYADAVFIILDNVDYLGTDPKRPGGAGKYEGRIDPAQMDFIRNLLAEVPTDKLLVVTLHIPLRTYIDPEDPAQNLTNRAEFLKLFEGRPHSVSFSGHTHTTEHHYLDAADGWTGPQPHHHHVLTAVSGSWWSGPYDHRGVAVADSRDGTPNGFHILSIDGTSYTTRYVPLKEPNGRQIRLSVLSHLHSEMRRDYRPGALIEPPIALAAVPSTTLVANVFDGGPKTTVTMRIGTAEPISMVRKAIPDPFVEDVFARNEAVKKAWVKAEVSSHMWTVRLPPTLGPGVHPVRVAATDQYGRVHHATLALEIAT